MKRFWIVFFLLVSAPALGRQVSTNAPVAKTVKKMILSYEEGKPFLDSFRTIVALGPSANPALLELARNEKLEIHKRWTAIRAVGRIGEARATPQLIELLANEHPFVRIGSLRALGDLGALSAVDRIMEVAEKDEAMVVRSAAVQVLGQLKATQALPTFEKALADERNFMKGQSLFIRKNAILAMGQLQTREATPILIRALDDKDEHIPLYAVHSLQQITGLKFEAKNQATINQHWKTWWERELQRTPEHSPKQVTSKI